MIIYLLMAFKYLLGESRVEIMLVLRNNFFKNITFGFFEYKMGFVCLFPLSDYTILGIIKGFNHPAICIFFFLVAATIWR